MNDYPRACVAAMALVLAWCAHAGGGEQPQDAPRALPEAAPAGAAVVRNMEYPRTTENPPWDPSLPTPGFQLGPVQDKVTPGRFFEDPPTIHSLGFRWYIEGDSNRNAAVAVEYRRKGSAAWREAQPMLRVQNEVVDQEFQYRVWRCGNLFAGSVLFLEPGTEYEVRFTMTDPDGGAPPPKVVTATTRVEPPRYEGERRIPVFPPDYKAALPPGAATDLGEALKQARPGDVVLLEPGVHGGPLVLENSGEPDRPIVLRGAGGGEAVIEVSGRAHIITLRGADHICFEDLTLRGGKTAIHAGFKGDAGSSHIVVRRCRINDVVTGIYTGTEDAENWLVVDNVIVGRNPVWHPRGSHMEPSAWGVNVYGRGHVVAYNRITRFGDSVSTSGVRPPSEDPQKHSVNIDIYHNDLSWAKDDIIETDYSCHNVRVWRNRGYNALVGLSVQPSYGGPVYLIRNEVYGVTYTAYKLHNFAAGIVAFHNTTCSPGDGFGGLDPGSRWQNGIFRNNLFMGGINRAIASGSLTPYSTLDYNGYRRNNPDRAQFISWFDGKTRRGFSSLEEFANATGHERHGIELDYDAFVQATPPQKGVTTEPTQWDLRLEPGSRAVDAGVRLPNINDDFIGKGPDLGAHEQGQPLPHLGPRVGDTAPPVKAPGDSLSSAWAAPSALGAAKTLVVEAGKHARAFVPMSIDLPEGVAQARMTCDGKEVPCQVVQGKLCWILDALAAGAAKTYRVDLGAAPGAGAGGVTLKTTDDRVEIAIDGKPFTAYHFTNAKIGTTRLQRPYFWPVLGPGQVPMTRPYPMAAEPLEPHVSTDHGHHTSIWVAHGDVNGVDNWAIFGATGWQVHRGFEATGDGPVVGWFREALDWTDGKQKPNLAEVRTVRVWRMPDTARLLDLELVFQAKYGKVTFGDTKEGGLCAARMRDELRADGKGGAKGRLVNSEGQTGRDAWGKKALWVDCSGTIDGQRLGFALFDAPGNLRHPTTWHARDYGLLTANPFGLKNFDKNAPETGDFVLDAGQSLTQRYRIYFHAGDEAEAEVAARYADWADPPKATWVESTMPPGSSGAKRP